MTVYRLISAATTNGNLVRTQGGRVAGWVITNTAASARYVKLYDKATSPTVGTDVPVVTIGLPANGRSEFAVPGNFSFANGIGIGITGAAADSDTTAVAANDVQVNIFLDTP